MLVLTRKEGESIRIRIGDVEAFLTVVNIEGNRVRLGLEAPREMEIMRKELVACPSRLPKKQAVA